MLNTVFWLKKYLLQPKLCEPEKKKNDLRTIQESGVNIASHKLFLSEERRNLESIKAF